MTWAAWAGRSEAGTDAWKNYMRHQTNTINWGSQLHMPRVYVLSFDDEW